MTGLPEDLDTRLAAAATGVIELTSHTTRKGVASVWCSLAAKDDLLSVAAVIKELGGRLSTVSAFQPRAPEEEEEESGAETAAPDGDEATPAAPKPEPTTFGGTVLDGHSYEMAYHFDLDGHTLTVRVFVPQGGAVDSLTSLFRNADWTEREFMETYAIAVRGHPDPRRLFIDPAIEPAVLERLIPYSTLVNSASTKGLWEQIMSKKGAAS